jgi:geranylgeranyl pyrophosphate synthase
MHRQKTGALIQASVLLGAISAGLLASPERIALAEFGAEIGLAFQIQDDILDVEGTTTSLGKRAGADADRVKPTYPSIWAWKNHANTPSPGVIAQLLRSSPGGRVLLRSANSQDFWWRAATDRSACCSGRARV